MKIGQLNMSLRRVIILQWIMVQLKKLCCKTVELDHGTHARQLSNGHGMLRPGKSSSRYKAMVLAVYSVNWIQLCTNNKSIA